MYIYIYVYTHVDKTGFRNVRVPDRPIHKSHLKKPIDSPKGFGVSMLQPATWTVNGDFYNLFGAAMHHVLRLSPTSVQCLHVPTCTSQRDTV